MLLEESANVPRQSALQTDALTTDNLQAPLVIQSVYNASVLL